MEEKGKESMMTFKLTFILLSNEIHKIHDSKLS